MTTTMIISDIAKSFAGVFVASQLRLSDKLNFGDSIIARSVSNGMVFFVISDAVNYVSNGSSKLLNGDIKGVFDDSLFLGTLALGAEVSKTDKILSDLLSKVISNEQLLYGLTDSVLVSGGRILGDYIDTSSTSRYAHMVRHPSLIFGS